MKKIFILIFLILNFLLLSTGKVIAQSVSLGIYPPILQIDATAPADIKAPINIQNQSDDTSFVNINVKAFQAASTNDGQVELLGTFANFPDPLFINRVQILDGGKRVSSLTLSPKQKKSLTLHILLPKDEPHGDYYFSITFTTTAFSNTLSNSSLQSGGIATNVLLSVGPKGQTQGFISDFSAPFFVNSGPVAFNLLFSNKSDHFITPTGEIIIKNMFGQNIGKVSLLPVNILANSQRIIPDANFPQRQDTKPTALWSEKFLIGPYTATLNLKLSDQGPIISRSISFFAFPATYIIGIFIIFAITIFIILRVRSKM